jgi:hypothetical protein
VGVSVASGVGSVVAVGGNVAVADGSTVVVGGAVVGVGKAGVVVGGASVVSGWAVAHAAESSTTKIRLTNLDAGLWYFIAIPFLDLRH